MGKPGVDRGRGPGRSFPKIRANLRETTLIGMPALYVGDVHDGDTVDLVSTEQTDL